MKKKPQTTPEELLSRADASRATRRTRAERHAAVLAARQANPNTSLRQIAEIANVAYDTVTMVLFGYRSSYPRNDKPQSAAQRLAERRAATAKKIKDAANDKASRKAKQANKQASRKAARKGHRGKATG